MSHFAIIMLGVILIAAGVITLLFDHNVPATIILLAMGIGAILFFYKSS